MQCVAAADYFSFCIALSQSIPRENTTLQYQYTVKTTHNVSYIMSPDREKSNN